MKKSRKKTNEKWSSHHQINHPPGLLVVSLVEIWERFGYYTARAVLVLFARDEIFASKENIKTCGSPSGSLSARDGRRRRRRRRRRFFYSDDEAEDEKRGVELETLRDVHRFGVPDTNVRRIRGRFHLETLDDIHRDWTHVAVRHRQGRKAAIAGCSRSVGNGGFKPNVSARLSEMYESNKRKSNSNNSNSNSNNNINNNNNKQRQASAAPSPPLAKEYAWDF